MERRGEGLWIEITVVAASAAADDDDDDGDYGTSPIVITNSTTITKITMAVMINTKKQQYLFFVSVLVFVERRSPIP